MHAITGIKFFTRNHLKHLRPIAIISLLYAGELNTTHCLNWHIMNRDSPLLKKFKD